ncbi:MAG TPA: PqqD family protein [Gemmatimonadales bacterium]|jgi:hypothetical protein
MDPQHAAPYTIRDDVLTAHLAGEAVLLDLKTKQYYQLNATAALIWKGLEQALEPPRIADALVHEFAVDAATAQREIERVIADLRARGLIV